MTMGTQDILRISLPSRIGTEKQAMDAARRFLGDRGLSDDELNDISTLISEACLNAMEHGNQLRAEVDYELELWLEGNTLFIRVTDRGGFKVWEGPGESARSRNIHDAMQADALTRGWGLRIIESLADAWKWQVEQDHSCMEIQFVIGSSEGGL